MLEYKRKKTLEAHGNRKQVKAIIDSLEEIRKEDSTADVLDLIKDLSSTYNLYISIPVELLNIIFKYLPLEDILRKRSVFLVCQEWTYRINNFGPFWKSVLFKVCGKTLRYNTHSLARIRSYCIMRYNLESVPKKSKGLSKLSKNSNVNFTIYEEKNSKVNGVECKEMFIEYYLWIGELEHLKVTVISSESQSRSSNKRFRIILDSGEICEHTYLYDDGKRYCQFIINRKCVQLLEKMNFLKTIMEKKIISSFKKSNGCFLGAVCRGGRSIKKLMIYIMSFIEIFRQLKGGSHWDPGGAFYGFAHFNPENVFIQLKRVGKGIRFKNFKKSGLKLFASNSLGI